MRYPVSTRTFIRAYHIPTHYWFGVSSQTADLSSDTLAGPLSHVMPGPLTHCVTEAACRVTPTHTNSLRLPHVKHRWPHTKLRLWLRTEFHILHTKKHRDTWIYKKNQRLLEEQFNLCGQLTFTLSDFISFSPYRPFIKPVVLITWKWWEINMSN